MNYLFIFSHSLIFDLRVLRIYVIFSFNTCDPFSLLCPVRLIYENSKSSKIKITSLKVKFVFCSIK